MKEKKDKKWFAYLSLGIMLIIIYKLLDNFTGISQWFRKFISILMPFILAIIVAYILYIPSKAIEKKIKNSKLKFLHKKARHLSVLIMYILAFVFIVTVINVIIPSLTQSITELAEKLPEFYMNLKDYFFNLPEESILKKVDISKLIESLEQTNILDGILQFINFENITSYAKGIVGIAGTIFDVFVIVVVSIYLLLERGEIKKFFKEFFESIFDEKTNSQIIKYYKKANRVFNAFISSQILDAFIVGILVSIVLLILRVKYALMLGFLIGLFNIIPYLGAILAVGIATIITLFTGGFTQALIMLVIVIILQQIDANIINPKILGTSLEISPILIIFSVTILGAYFGILGMFLAVPIAAMIKVLLIDFIHEKNKK